MVNIDTVYQRVLALANKEQRGYITPIQFNLFANQAQMDIFEQYFYDRAQFGRISGNSTVHADNVDILEEKISVFESTLPLTMSNGVGELETLGNFYRLTSVRDGNIFFESVTRKKARLFQLSPLVSPTEIRPVYTLDQANNRITVFGRTPASVDIDYIKVPEKVGWSGFNVDGTFLYNSTDSINFELHASEEPNLVLNILKLAAISMKDTNLYQMASAEETKDIQQEKQ